MWVNKNSRVARTVLKRHTYVQLYQSLQNVSTREVTIAHESCIIVKRHDSHVSRAYTCFVTNDYKVKLSFNPVMQQQRKHFAACGRMAFLAHTFTFHLRFLRRRAAKHTPKVFLNLNAFYVCIIIPLF